MKYVGGKSKEKPRNAGRSKNTGEPTSITTSSPGNIAAITLANILRSSIPYKQQHSTYRTPNADSCKSF